MSAPLASMPRDVRVRRCTSPAGRRGGCREGLASEADGGRGCSRPRCAQIGASRRSLLQPRGPQQHLEHVVPVEQRRGVVGHADRRRPSSRDLPRSGRRRLRSRWKIRSSSQQVAAAGVQLVAPRPDAHPRRRGGATPPAPPRGSLAAPRRASCVALLAVDRDGDAHQARVPSPPPDRSRVEAAAAGHHRALPSGRRIARDDVGPVLAQVRLAPMSS